MLGGGGPRRYLIGIRNNISPAGNDGTQHTHYVRRAKIDQQGERFATMHKLDEVWLMNEYTQKMCEMKMSEFVEYVRSHGTRII